ncbi:uncharacterized protein E5676_scaffold552G00220 [Cucumis melo var. makuwa]|uniref:Flocculation protein FLO11-like n=2 Tax=Cucumis melo var. makuwa TaxID=1194695 RepID=A0A5D3CSZ0_CUCMM|nr:uncharacterized protein E5676_scaffold552G00220 [Cucumis melo var. makuwa]
MVNTRRGNYQATSSEDVHEVPASKSTMHVVHASESSYRLENDEFVAESAAKGIEIAPSVFETHISKMDSNEQDNVLLARLLKKDFVSNVASAKSADPVILAHSQESSSSKEVFIPTPGFHHVASEELGPSRHSPLVRSLVSNDVTAPHPHSTPAPVPVDTFTETEGRIDVSNDETHVNPLKYLGQRGRNFNRIDVTLPPRLEGRRFSRIFHLSPLMEDLFTLKKMFNIENMLCSEGLLMRKFIVNLPSNFNDPSSPDYQTVHIRGLKFKISPTVFHGFLGNNVEFDCSPSNPNNEVLVFVLSRGTLFTWSVNGIPAVTLSVKYAILHKIGITN